MPLNPNLLLQGQPAQIQLPDPNMGLNSLARALQVQAAMGQNELATYGLSKARRQDEQMTGLMREIQSGGVDLSTPEGQRRAISLAPEFAPTLIEHQLKLGEMKSTTDKNTAEAGKFQQETVDKAAIRHRDQLANVNNPQQAAAWVQAQHNDPLLGPVVARMGTVDQAIASIPTDPAGFQDWKMRNALGMTKYAELNRPTTTVVNAGGTSQVLQTPGLGGAPQRVATVAHTVSPDAVLSAQTSRANTAANIAKDYAVAGLNPNGSDPNGTIGGLTPQAIENAAKRYNFDGTLPPSIGRGTQGARDLRAIQNRAAELNTASPTDASGGRAGQMVNKADVGALNKITSQQQLASTFERTANMNADLALGLSKKLDRTGVPLINAGLQAWRTGTGSPEATQFAAANETFVNEYAKIMSGGMGSAAVTDSARAKAHGLLSTAMTPQQYEGNVRLLQTEMQNRMKGYEDQANEIRTRMRGGQAPVGSGTTPAAAVAPAGAIPSGWNVKVR